MCSLDRRTFLKGGLAGIGLFMVGQEILAYAADEEDDFAGPPVKLAIIGAGQWGRTLLASAVKQPSVKAVSVCDTYAPFLAKCKEIAPNITTLTDYRQALDAKGVEAVVVATPSNLHKEIVLAALQAGKHVYCEAPIAHSVDDAREIAKAAGASKQVFQPGLQGRCNTLYKHVLSFVKTGVLGTPIQVSAQWHKKQSWRRAAPTPDRERDLNWRLSKATSAGLIGEQGVHHLDLACWFLGGLPVSAMGFGSILKWSDGRDVPDTVQCVLEFPKSVRATFSATLAGSCGGSYTLIEGSNSSLLLRDNRAWMIKEADAPTLGWEVYARKEPCNGDTGICLVADATKLVEEGKDPGKIGSVTPDHDAVYYALGHFAECVRGQSKPICGITEGLQSTLVAIRANESIVSGASLTYDSAFFGLG